MRKPRPTKQIECIHCKEIFTSVKHSSGWSKYCPECVSKAVWSKNNKVFRKFNF